MTSKSNIPLKGPSVNIVHQCGPCLSDILQSKFGCTATIEGVEFEEPIAAHQTRLMVAHEKRFEGTLPTGVRVSVWKADLTEFSADAVVNAANEALQHIGGLALALSTAGGPRIQKESDGHINVFGHVKTGDAIVTTAGKLKCKMIIHAVGPQLTFNPHRYEVDQAEPLLKRTIYSILDRVEENQLETVAIPAISSGIFNYPLPQCADTIVKAVKNYYELFPRYRPKEILLVNNDEPTVKEMVRACHMILSHQQQPTSYSGAAASNSRDGGKTSATSVQMGSVRLTLKKGKIEEQTTDVIVNATFNKQWSGQISAALLKKAGEGIREELRSATISGNIAVTRACNLHSWQVYHIFYPQTAVTELEAQQWLFLSIRDCLQTAAKHHHKSISFPAIATGGKSLSKENIAQLMTQAVAEFAQMWKEKMDVCFVIFPSDDYIFKVFEQQLKNLQPKTVDSWEKPKEYNTKSEHSENFHKTRAPPPPPHISVMGPSDAAVCEASRWLSGLLLEGTGPVLIQNNFILHFGEKEQHQLTRLPGVSIKEEFKNSRASITVDGREHEAVAVAALQVEAMLCTIQKEFITEEESIMLQSTQTKTVSVQREKMNQFGPLFAGKKALFDHTGMRIAKVDEVKNATLQTLFDLKKNQLKCSKTQKMYQRIPAQFIELISHVGFHSECAPPDDPAYGQGIYFADTVRRAMEVWKVSDEEYVHFVEAEVLVGESTPGKPEFILPPACTSDPHQNYDSVSGPGIAVIFSSYQALPKCIITCKRI